MTFLHRVILSAAGVLSATLSSSVAALAEDSAATEELNVAESAPAALRITRCRNVMAVTPRV